MWHLSAALLVQAQARLLRGLTKAQAKVLLVLLAHANRNGLAWPSVSTIAAETGMTERSVWRAIAGLVGKGLVMRAGRQMVFYKGRRVFVIRYRVLPERGDPLTGRADPLTVVSVDTRDASPDSGVRGSSVASPAGTPTGTEFEQTDGPMGTPQKAAFDPLTAVTYGTRTMKSKELTDLNPDELKQLTPDEARRYIDEKIRSISASKAIRRSPG